MKRVSIDPVGLTEDPSDLGTGDALGPVTCAADRPRDQVWQ
jgi:hypothetical protein